MLGGGSSKDVILSDFHSKRSAAEPKGLAVVLGGQNDGQMSRTREMDGWRRWATARAAGL